MNIKNTTLSLFLLLATPLFAQGNLPTKTSNTFEPKQSYLDSIKKTFVNNALASRVDSLWMKELTSLDLYNTISQDIKNVNIDEQVDFELPTAVLKERLAAMDAKSPFNIEYNQGLENIIKSFLKNRKKSFERLMGVSEYYFPIFEEALAKQNVPLEIKYLAVVESALNPRAVSKMGATGLWQFMYHTGKQYGLKIDSYVDERSDPLKSSEAATQYMSNMYKIFGDWDLVLASYNSGPGNVSKAIRRSGGQRNYWNIRKNLPKETQGYLPAFLATMYLYEYHNEHGMVPQRASVKHFATDTIRIKQQMSFKQIGDLLDVPIAQLQLLNPSYKLNVIPFYKDKNHFLRLPKDKIGIFVSNEDQIYAYARYELDQRERPFEAKRTVLVHNARLAPMQNTSGIKATYYKVKSGDNLSTLANKYNVSIAQLKKWNNLKSNSIAYGRNLKIGTTQQEISAPTEPKKQAIVSQSGIKNTTPATQDKTIYTVQKGDNLGRIAQKYNVTVAELQEWNGLLNNNLQYGVTLHVANNPVQHKEELVVINEKKELNQVAIGTDKGTVNSFKTKVTVPTSIQKEATDYYVKKGDSLFSIARKYPGVTISDLKKWNDIRNEDIQPGMKLKING